MEVINSVFSMEQSAFVKGRHILDGHFLLNGVVDWSKSLGNPINVV